MLRPIALALMLTACTPSMTPGQTLYGVLGSYSTALKVAADYGESPTAEPAVVARLNAANRSNEVQTAYTYARAYVACSGSSQSVVVGIDCSAFDFRATTASSYAITLRTITATILKETAR